MEQRLEQILEFAPGKTKTLATIDTYLTRTAALHSGDMRYEFGYGMHTPAVFTPAPMPTFNTCDIVNIRPYEPPKLDLTPKLDIPSYGSLLPENKEPMTVYDMPGSKLQMHLHQDCAAGSLKLGNNRCRELNSYESAMADLYATNMGFKRKNVTCNKYEDYL